MATATEVNTKQVTGRRQVSYSTYDDLVTDAEQLAAGDVRTLGNWSYGQILKHLAEGLGVAIDGTPFNVPWPMRFIAKTFLKGMFLNKTMKPGFKFPASVRPQLEPPAEITVEEGLAALRLAVVRVKTETSRQPHPLLGEMTLAEHERFQLRHAEMHMSFVVPAA